MTVAFVSVNDVTSGELGRELAPDPPATPSQAARQRAEVEAAALAAIMGRDPSARLLYLVAGAFRLHGFGAVGVGLYLADVFPEHAGGVGICAGLPVCQRPAGTWLLKSMGVDDVHDVRPGVLGTLRGPLLAVPPPGTCPEPVELAGPVARTCPWCNEPFIPRSKQVRMRFCCRDHATRYREQRRASRPA